MRRGLLLVIGFSGSLMVAAVLWMSVSSSLTMQTVKLPVDVEQTKLTVLELRSYDGPFVEDGSCRQVSDVAALVLHNRGTELLETGAVKLRIGDELLVFSFTMLPPGGRVLVLEKTGKLFPRAGINGCWGWSVTGGLEERILVEEAGRTSLALINICGETVERAFVYYKDYDPGQQMYIGGVTHILQVRRLQPGQRVVLPVFRYLSGSSMVLQ